MAKDIQGLIESLQGTCMKTIESEKVHFGWKEDEELTLEELAEIDNEIFQCDCCCLWCEVSEMAYDGVCSNCEDQMVEEMMEDWCEDEED